MVFYDKDYILLWVYHNFDCLSFITFMSLSHNYILWYESNIDGTNPLLLNKLITVNTKEAARHMWRVVSNRADV